MGAHLLPPASVNLYVDGSRRGREARSDTPPSSYLLDFTGPKNLTFWLVPPATTNGRTQADMLDGHILKFRQADAIGWVNMIVKMDASEQTILGLELNKTLPDGTVYDLGIVCGQALY